MILLDPTSAIEFDRYLVPFDLRRVPTYRFDVVVMGSGVAGATAAITAARSGADVALVSKGPLSESNTRWAQGGMAAVLGEEDSFDSHVDDTLRVGCGLCDPTVVERVVRGGPAAVEQLLSHGANLDRTPDGTLELSKEGGHAHPRVVHAQDATGEEIQRSLCEALAAERGISTFPGIFALDLLKDGEGRVRGFLGRTDRGELVAFDAGSVVMATGGAGQIYRETTNPSIATADGVAMAVRAGAVARDMEFIQFHPTCLYIAGAARVLISEVVRGAGGVLRDRHGVRFMPDHHSAAELAPRDVVSRAVFQRMVATDDTNVYLDLSHLDRDPHQAFPGISRICRFFGIDIARDPIPVRPGCHYMIGGLAVDDSGKTSLPGLWAVGECASSGLHGANRMGSNSLLEGLVLGDIAGREAADSGRGSTSARLADSRRVGKEGPPVPVNIDDLTYSLKSLMWRELGVVRHADGMGEALEKIRFWSRALRALPLDGPRSFELANMLTVAQLISISALAREESRGVHHRADKPESRDDWRAHLCIRPVQVSGEVSEVRIERSDVAGAALQR